MRKTPVGVFVVGCLTTTFSREDGVGRSQDSACGRVFESYEKTKAGHHGLESNGT